MNRNTRTLIVLAVAILMAAIAAYGVWLAEKSRPVREVEVARTQAVVAIHPLSVGTLVTKDDLCCAMPSANPNPARSPKLTKP
jgi:Flp pilus assembly protein CpaB